MCLFFISCNFILYMNYLQNALCSDKMNNIVIFGTYIDHL